MSEENVEIVRNALEHFAATDGLCEFLTLWREPCDDWSGRPHGSDAEVPLDYGLHHSPDDGPIRRIEAYATPEEALAAARLGD